MANDEPHHQELHFLQIQLFSSLVVVELVDNMTIIVDFITTVRVSLSSETFILQIMKNQSK